MIHSIGLHLIHASRKTIAWAVSCLGFVEDVHVEIENTELTNHNGMIYTRANIF